MYDRHPAAAASLHRRTRPFQTSACNGFPLCAEAVFGAPGPSTAAFRFGVLESSFYCISLCSMSAFFGMLLKVYCYNVLLQVCTLMDLEIHESVASKCI